MIFNTFCYKKILPRSKFTLRFTNAKNQAQLQQLQKSVSPGHRLTTAN